MTLRPFGTDASAPTEEPDSPGSDNSSAGSDVIDWESDENPYKQRVSGLDTANEQLRQDLEEARSVRGLVEGLQGTVNSLTARVQSAEDLAAEGLDATVAATREREIRDGLVDANDDPAGPSRVDQVRQARANESRTEMMTRYFDELNGLYRDGMNADQRVTDMIAKWREIQRAGGSRDIEIGGLLTDMRAVADEYDEKAAGDNGSAAGSDDNNARGSGSEDEPGDDSDSDDGEDADADDGDEEPSALERNRNRPESRIGGNGSAVDLDPDSMTPLEKIDAHVKGLKPPGQ